MTCPPSTERFKVSPAELVPSTRQPNEGKGKKPSPSVEEDEEEEAAVAN